MSIIAVSSEHWFNKIHLSKEYFKLEDLRVPGYPLIFALLRLVSCPWEAELFIMFINVYNINVPGLATVRNPVPSIALSAAEPATDLL